MKKSLARALVYLGIIIAIVATGGLILTWGGTATLTLFGITATYAQWFGAVLVLGLATAALGYAVDPGAASDAMRRITKVVTDPIKQLAGGATASLLPILLIAGGAYLLLSASDQQDIRIVSQEKGSNDELVEES